MCSMRPFLCNQNIDLSSRKHTSPKTCNIVLTHWCRPLAPGGRGSNVKSWIFKHISRFKVRTLKRNCSQMNAAEYQVNICLGNALPDQTTSHYLSHWWLRFMSLFGVTRLQWVNMSLPATIGNSISSGWSADSTRKFNCNRFLIYVCPIINVALELARRILWIYIYIYICHIYYVNFFSNIWRTTIHTCMIDVITDNALNTLRLYEFCLRFHWSLCLRVQLAISQYWLVQ